MPFNYTFSFPSKKLANETKNDAMKALANEIAKVTGAYQEFAHPIEINWDLAPHYLKAASEVSERLRLADPIPKLCTLVTAAAFDAAIHDAYGKANGVNSFDTYGPDFMNHDLSRYLGADYKGRYPGDYLLRQHRPGMTLCHLVSTLDPIEDFENKKPIKDGLPETLPEWINYNGLLELKIKVSGTDLKWDIERVTHIDKVTTQTQEKRGVKDWAYVLDFNEKCPNVDYFIQFCRQLKEQMPIGYQRIKYTEQPTARDLKAHPENVMHEAAKLCPVVIDESLIDVESLLLARKLGWTGSCREVPQRTHPHDPDRVSRGKGEDIPLRWRHELPRRRADPDGQFAGARADHHLDRGQCAPVFARSEQGMGIAISGYVPRNRRNAANR
jgi:hypothetical protein